MPARRALIVPLACLVAVCLAAPAFASDTKVVALGFPDGAPGDARVGADADVRGAVRSVEPDVVDFHGRSVISLDDDRRLDPGTGTFSVGLRMRLTRGAGDWNIVQKGYWDDAGQWKLSLDTRADGLRFSCRFKGDAGEVMAYSNPGVVRVDGPWVVVVCARDGGRVSISVDGEDVGSASGSIGRVANGRPVLIGSKGLEASQPDQFLGEIDWLWVRS